MTEIPKPETYDELEENKEAYQRRVEWRDEQSEGWMGSVLLPREGASEMAIAAFHELMTEWGADGIEYAQEALHQNGDYFDDFFDDVEEVREDMRRFEEIIDENDN